MAASTWKAQVLERVTEAGGCFDSLRRYLFGEVARLAQPMHIADAQGARDTIDLSLRNLGEGVYADLALAASSMAAAEIIALRGAAADPTNPLPSAEHVPALENSVRLALGELRRARGVAEDAYNSLMQCHGHLCAALVLLRHPGLPGVDGFLDSERDAAHGNLEAALAFAVESENLVITARQLVR